MKTVIDRVDVNLTDAVIQAEEGAAKLQSAVAQVEEEVAAVNLTAAVHLVDQLDALTPSALGLVGDMATQAEPLLAHIIAPARALATTEAPHAIELASNISALLVTALPPLRQTAAVLRGLPSIGDCSYLTQRRDALLQASCGDVEPALNSLMWCIVGCALAATVLVVAAICLQIRVGRVGQPSVRLFRAPSSSEPPDNLALRDHSQSRLGAPMTPPVATGMYITPGAYAPETVVQASHMEYCDDGGLRGPNHPPDKSDIMLSGARYPSSDGGTSGIYPELPPAGPSTSGLYVDRPSLSSPCSRASRPSRASSAYEYNAQL